MRTAPALLICACLLAFPSCKWAFQKLSELIHYEDTFDSGNKRKEGSLADGIQTGDWTYYHEDGSKRAEGPYENDRQVGAWTYWYASGEVEWEGEFDRDGYRTGRWTFNYDNGSPKAQGSFLGDREMGLWTFWDRNGQLTQEGHFADGRMLGPWTYWHPSGEKKAEGLYFKGDRVGPWRYWDENNTESTTEHTLPSDVALVRETWSDGAPKRLGLMQDGHPVGCWATWHQTGELRLVCRFQNGSASGAWSAHQPSGGLLADGTVQGNTLGTWSHWPDDFPVPQDQGPLPQLPPSTGNDWSAPSIIENTAAAELVAIWMREMRSAAEPVVARATPTTEPESQVQALPGNPRVPAAKQPEWTVLEAEELDSYVQDYLEGKKPSRKSRKRYAVPAARKAKPRRREDLENKPFPLKEMTATDGETIQLADYHGKKRVLVVILRGFSGQVCVYCVAQTEALAQCHDTFDDLNLEVLVVYPGPEGDEESFLAAYRDTFGKGNPPYRVFYDPDLAMVKQLGIQGGDLAYPTTVLVDDEGTVRYAYTGAHRADRPAAKQLIELIRNL